MDNEKIRLLETELRAIRIEISVAEFDSEEQGMDAEASKLWEATLAVSTAISLLEQLALGERNTQ